MLYALIEIIFRWSDFTVGWFAIPSCSRIAHYHRGRDKTKLYVSQCVQYRMERDYLLKN